MTAPASSSPEPLTLDRRSRRVLAAQAAGRLARAAWALGGYASAELLHAPAGLAPRRPAVAVMVGETPADGRVSTAPLLVVELAPSVAWEEWLLRGAQAVWLLGAGCAHQLSPGCRVELLRPPGVLELDGTGLRLPVPAATLRVTM